MQGKIVRLIGNSPENVCGHDYANSKLVEYQGKHWVVSNKAILTVVVAKACNSSCKFCSNEITFTPDKPYLRWNESLEKIRDFCSIAKIEKVAFTGGEPTLVPHRLLELVKGFSPITRRRRIHTNGFNLLNPVSGGTEGESLLEALGEAGINGVSLSVAHPDPATNEIVMRNGKWPGLNDRGISAIAEICNRRGISIRLSCVMTHESIRSLSDIDQYIAWGKRLGIKKFIFRAASVIPREFSLDTNFTQYNQYNWIDLRPIVKEFRNRKDWELVFFQDKTDSYLHVFKSRDGVLIDIDESSEEIDPDPKIRRLILMPDGELYTSWLDDKAKLFDQALEVPKRARDPIRKWVAQLVPAN